MSASKNPLPQRYGRRSQLHSGLFVPKRSHHVSGKRSFLGKLQLALGMSGRTDHFLERRAEHHQLHSGLILPRSILHLSGKGVLDEMRRGLRLPKRDRLTTTGYSESTA